KSERLGSVREADLRAGHLAERVHAGIRAPGAMNGHGRALELRERLFEQPLYRFAVSLPLPADEPRAVVREREFENSHLLTTKVASRQPRSTRGRFGFFVCFVHAAGLR